MLSDKSMLLNMGDFYLQNCRIQVKIKTGNEDELENGFSDT